MTHLPERRDSGLRVGVTGAAGMLGSALTDVLSADYEVCATDLHAGRDVAGGHWDVFDLLDAPALDEWLATWRPRVVVHCAAMVDVDACEQDPDRAEALHVSATERMARRLGAWGGRLAYISTDAVFDGGKDGLYDELDTPHPLNAYARTKLMGEAAALAVEQSLVLRTNIFGWTRGERPSFAEWVLRGLAEPGALRMFTDVCFTPIHVTHLSAVISQCVELGLAGLYHASGSTVLSKRDFAARMAIVFGVSDAGVVASNVEDAGLGATRPKNMGLANARLGAALSRPLEGVDEGLRLMRRQYEEGWAAELKGRALGPEWRFWEAP